MAIRRFEDRAVLRQQAAAFNWMFRNGGYRLRTLYASEPTEVEAIDGSMQTVEGEYLRIVKVDQEKAKASRVRHCDWEF